MVMASFHKISYPQRLFLYLLGYSLLLVAFFISFQYKREKDFKAAELDAVLQAENRRLLEAMDGGGILSVEALSQAIAPGYRVSVIDFSGRVVFDNSLDSLPAGNHLDRSEIRSALEKGSGYTVRRHSESSGGTYFYSATRGKSAIVRCAIPYSVTLNELLKADYGYLWIMTLVSALICLVGFVLARRLGQNISRLRDFAESAQRGERIYDSEPFPHDELGDISANIVRLYARLQQALSDRDKEHQAALSEQQEKIRVKKQLTDNINHELKTPVAAMRLCIETLQENRDMPSDLRQGFMDRCEENVKRLSSLLEDVSTITRMDEGGQSISMDRVNVCAIVEDCLEETRPLARSKGIDIRFHSSGDTVISGNAGLLGSVFSNLLSNSIAYSGCSLIDISVLGEDDRVAVEFSDNGCGVPQEHLSHIFERFYRIDKGRSRKNGGTGLGLSIVKNAVTLHGGSISAENVPTGGLRFRFTLRCQPPTSF